MTQTVHGWQFPLTFHATSPFLKLCALEQIYKKIKNVIVMVIKLGAIN